MRVGLVFFEYQGLLVFFNNKRLGVRDTNVLYNWDCVWLRDLDWVWSWYRNLDWYFDGIWDWTINWNWNMFGNFHWVWLWHMDRVGTVYGHCVWHLKFKIHKMLFNSFLVTFEKYVTRIRFDLCYCPQRERQKSFVSITFLPFLIEDLTAEIESVFANHLFQIKLISHLF